MDSLRSASGGSPSTSEESATPAQVVESCAAPRLKTPQLTWLQPAKRAEGVGLQTVWEQGIEYTLSVRCENAAVQALTLTLFDANTYSSWWSETVLAKAAPVIDGVVRVSWRCPRDLPLSDTYVLAARSVPAGLAEAQVRSAVCTRSVLWSLLACADGTDSALCFAALR